MTGKLLFDFRSVKESLDLPSGVRVVLVDTLGRKDLSEEEAARNIFAFADDKVLWRVRSKFDGARSGPFTKLSLSDAKLTAYRWDGGEYNIDATTGFATPGRFLK